MASSATTFVSRDEYKQKKAIEEARKCGQIPAEKDEQGNDINPHMPQYITVAPWYLNQSQASLKHQKFFKPSEKIEIDTWYRRGEKGYQATKYRKGACENCGAITHKTKFCFDRPRKNGAKFTETNILPDDIIKDVQLDYDGKRDRWNGYDPEEYNEVIKEHELFENERKKRLLNDGESKTDKDGIPVPNDDDDYKQQDGEDINFEDTQRDPKTKTTAKALRIREDQAKYLYNLDPSSAHFDPKSRSLRQNPNPDLPFEDQVFKGENYYKYTGDTTNMLMQERLAWEKIEKNELNINLTSDPTLMERTYKKINLDQKIKLLENQQKMIDQYGGGEHIKNTQELITIFKDKRDQTDVEFEKEDNEQKASYFYVDTKLRTNLMVKSKYPEDQLINNHPKIWGSWYNDVLGWGYDCCFSNDKYSMCEGENGKKLATVREYKARKQKEEQVKSFLDKVDAGQVGQPDKNLKEGKD